MKINQRGFTLVELLIVLGITSLIIALAISQFLFGAKVMAKGDSQQNIQYHVRRAADFISKETRNAVEIELIEVAAIPVTADPNNYIYLDANIIRYRQANGILVVDKTGANISNTGDFTLEIKKVNNRFFLAYHIKGTEDDQTYILDSEVLLNNIKTVTLASNKIAVRYKKP